MNKAVFIDKDGTLIPNVPYNADPSLIHLQEGAANGLKRLKDEGYLLILISNQSGVALGHFREEALQGVVDKLQEELGKGGVSLDGVYFCPHHPDGTVKEYAVACDCRKPQPGMLIHAAENFHIDLSHSWMIGDILHDVEAGNRAGCSTILIDNGNETQWQAGPQRRPTGIARNIPEAVSIILYGNKRA